MATAEDSGYQKLWKKHSENPLQFGGDAKSCKLNYGSAYLNDAELRYSSQIDYYEAICLFGLLVMMREDGVNGSHKEHTSQSSKEIELIESVAYNLTKLQECFSIRENVVLYELNGFVAENVTSLGDLPI
uniref:Uncharacterized protein n=1 Tax=Parascaris univalens TaxID=6257 RepID=A0A915ALB7_PARUN